MPAPHRTGIPQACHRALKSFALEVMLVQRSFQPPPLPTVRVVGGHVVLALARHVEARLLQGGDDAGPVLHRAALDAPQQVVPDLVPGIGLMRDLRPQLRRLEVGAVPMSILEATARTRGGSSTLTHALWESVLE